MSNAQRTLMQKNDDVTLAYAADFVRGALDQQWVRPPQTIGPRANPNYSSTNFGRRDWAAFGRGK